MAKTDNSSRVGPEKGEFIPPPEETDATPEALPQQEQFWRPPVRFGSIPVEKEPLGWDRRRGFRKLFPQVMLPTQVVDRVSFGYPDLEPNRLFWGDNLHVMRQLPSESIDLIYIDPPFFSGRQYNVIFGDRNELRSFNDTWDQGMPGYLAWLNARLYEMKRLLKRTGSIYVHCDWHASHYIKVEMDKIFGFDNFSSEIIWWYSWGGRGKDKWNRKHDTILYYRKTNNWVFNSLDVLDDHKLIAESSKNRAQYKGALVHHREEKKTPIPVDKVLPSDTWYIATINAMSKERIGYPTQKPEALLERIIRASSNEGDIIADFFCGGGTTPAVAQRLNRRWITCDQSRVAVAITADRVSRLVDEKIGMEFPVPDFTVEHWGVYEAARLAASPPEQFREFVLRAFGAAPDDSETGIHGRKGAIPIWVGEPDQRKSVTALEVQEFANAIRKTVRYQQDNLRDGIMLAWAFRPDAEEAAERLKRLEHTDLDFIKLDLTRIDMPTFRQRVTGLTTDHADYSNFLTFVQPPRVEAGWKRLAPRHYRFDVSETIVMNSGAKIINVQWDFNYGLKFTSSPGYSFIRNKKKEPALQTDYIFPHIGKFHIACKVQDDMGGEGIWSGEIEVN